MPRWIETDTLSNQDISSALAIGAYTADADRLILVQFFADQVAGNGDYVFYITHRLGGAGSSYRHIPITTAAAASGVTAIAGQSNMIAVRSGDVLTVYLDGLAGDTTTPDTSVRWFELDSMVLAATQGAITWGQQVISANVDSQGALQIVNAHASGYGTYASGVYGQYNVGTSVGQLNQGAVGQQNYGSTTNGQYNQGTTNGQYNYGDTANGQYNYGATAGQRNFGVSDSIVGSLSGSVGSVTGAVGSVSGNVTGSVGSIATGGIASASFAAGAIDAAAIAADAIGSSELAATAVNEIADQVWDELIAGHLTAGTTGAKLNLIGTAAYTVTSPTSSDGTAITIVRGDDYLLTDSRQLAFTSTGWPTITGATVKLRVKFGKNATVTEYSATVTGAQACYVALTTTQTAAMVPGVYKFDLQATLSNASVVTLVQGTLSVWEDVR